MYLTVICYVLRLMELLGLLFESVLDLQICKIIVIICWILVWWINSPQWTFCDMYISFSSVQSLSRVWLFATPWSAARQASLSITNSRSSFRLTSIESVMPSSHLILSRPLLLLPPVPSSIRVFSNESTLRMRWPNISLVETNL